ncbi:MAG: greA [Gammaproteobacteria bacterium]|jgi:transcription elongation factor GreA|nr:greA [Gammaproteobacteria bacterium]
MIKFPMTLAGEQALKIELERLERIERPRIVAAISEARAHGDLKENAEYHAAKEQQGLVEARVRDIKEKLSNAQIIDITAIKNDGQIVFGATVTLLNIETEEEVTYQIVGQDEADLKHNKISISSPIARALIGKSLDSEVEVKTPGGVVYYEVIKVEYV